MQPDRIYRKETKVKTLWGGFRAGRKTLRRIYKYADVFHCEPIEKTAYDFITSNNIASGEDIIKTLMEVYDSWIDSAISNYNSDFYYQPRDYIRECYREGEVIWRIAQTGRGFYFCILILT